MIDRTTRVPNFLGNIEDLDHSLSRVTGGAKGRGEHIKSFTNEQK